MSSDNSQDDLMKAEIYANDELQRTTFVAPGTSLEFEVQSPEGGEIRIEFTGVDVVEMAKEAREDIDGDMQIIVEQFRKRLESQLFAESPDDDDAES